MKAYYILKALDGVSRVCMSVALQNRNVYIYDDDDDTSMKQSHNTNTSKLITSKCNSLDVISLLHCYTTYSLLAFLKLVNYTLCLAKAKHVLNRKT